MIRQDIPETARQLRNRKIAVLRYWRKGMPHIAFYWHLALALRRKGAGMAFPGAPGQALEG
ncbi:hypothetical protein AAV99_10595 [Aurantiacibacter marinus]|uniref:Uncharacterized protein n=1 Tax=Aurantiacibacter marinus TaxID=874156 RepID=A0A0H0XLA6_9SPHN|nr:hypothetical protein AAV99_10595 [Aurantiacibacter marinus]